MEFTSKIISKKIIPVKLLNLIRDTPSNWASGIFKAFADIQQDCVLHIENLSSLFGEKTIKEEFYNSLVLGWSFAKKEYRVVLVGECINPDEINRFVLDLFNVFKN
jgi:hypothetical protein